MANPLVLQFRKGVSLARPAPFPVRQLTVRRWAAGDYGHSIGNTLFSSSVRIVFSAIVNFNSGCNWADLWHYFFTSLFPKTRTTKIYVLCLGGQNTRVLPFLKTTLVCRLVGCGCLTPLLKAPLLTSEFFVIQSKNCFRSKITFRVFLFWFFFLFLNSVF